MYRNVLVAFTAKTRHRMEVQQILIVAIALLQDLGSCHQRLCYKASSKVVALQNMVFGVGVPKRMQIVSGHGI